jgi:F0F1-type ATP synthase membrane subunit a
MARTTDSVEGSTMNLSADQQVFWRHGIVTLNGTIVMTWALMAAMTLAATVACRQLKTDGPISRWQSAVEIIVTSIEDQIKQVGLAHPEEYLPFLGTLFLFIALSSLCTILPGFVPPTLLFPVFMTALGLLTGMVQAYIFTILAAVYIAAATTPRTRENSHG